MSEQERAESRRARWSEEARRDWYAMLANAPNSAAAERARVVLRLAKACAMPDQWAVLASWVAFLLPSNLSGEMANPRTVGLTAAADFLTKRNAPAAQAFAERAAVFDGRTLVVDLRKKAQ